MKHLETYSIFNGEQQIWQHFSASLNCEMKFAIYLPDTAKSQNLPVLYLSEQLKPELFCQAADRLDVNYQFHLRAGCDHSYYFIASFIGEHIAFHATHLRG
ncbi:hypothetical protein A6B39_10990 [Mannheimia granulomatis]|uniref:alpha/beta hydrolase-fold protein n=1 Tax=Mannheimia granulomatis TaxID=85402 RepID=UPI00159E77B4|nr:alpha/beta hydrolase-fold protein [Mannheimia granulomatis]QLB15937.1 hypothetical protein A6B39_10990 [Mannheimia granulomatis]